MRRALRRGTWGWLAAGLILAAWSSQWLGAQEAEPSIAGWTPGEGWGHVWGPDDEVGALNAMSPTSVLAATAMITEGRVYDLGVAYDRESFKWPGHSPGEIISFRSPEGVKRQKDVAIHDNAARTAWHSCALFINDNVATQIDGLGHVTSGDDNHWYNGFTEAEWGGDFGPRKCDAAKIPPIVTRGVMLDVAGYKGVEALPTSYRITVADIKGTLKWSGATLKPGDTVLIRTGTLRHWGENGSNHAKLAVHDNAGMSLEATKFLIEQHGSILLGTDTSGYEAQPAPKGSASFIPVHEYLLIEQGVHIGELHFLEDLARDKVYEFCYVAAVNKIRGATAGFTMRPIAIR